MTLDQLYYFRKLAELQHYSKSADELFISQPSLSYSIKKLEKELGTSLFHKKGRNVVLTSQGNEFYNCIVDVLTRLEDGVSMMKQYSNNNTSKISIGTLPIFSGDFITKNIRSFMQIYPKTTFDIFTCIDNKSIINGINDGTYDIGLCFKVENEKDLVYVPILRQELVVITKSNHELANKKSLKLSDLQKYPLITYRENNPIGIYIRTLFNEQKIKPNIVFSFDEEITISEMVTQDFGVAILTNIPMLKNYVSIIPLDLRAESPILYLVYHKNSNHSQAIQKFKHHLIASAAFNIDNTVVG